MAIHLKTFVGGRPDERSHTETPDAEGHHRRAAAPRRGRLLKVLLPLGIFICVTSFILTTLFPSGPLRPRRTTTPRTLSRSQLEALAVAPNARQDDDPAAAAPGPRRLRLFMPADGPHINLCKTVMSAVALGYPMPTMINWNGEFNRPEWHFAGSHIAKLESLLAALDVLDSQKDDQDTGDDDDDDDDLVLLVDAYDVWFQLPPSVLIERFHRLNRDADARVARQWADSGHSSSSFPVSPPRQQIIVTTAKDCQPDWESGSNPRYEYWPESPLPTDFYGEGTDTVLSYGFDSARKYKKIRPRCVNSGMIMGTAASLRAALRRATDKADAAARAGRQLWSDQALLAEVIGDQEMWRYWMRGLVSGWNGTDAREEEGLPRDVRRVAAAATTGERFEFGIGLDYEFATVPPTCSSEDDGFFVKIDDGEALKKASEEAGVPDGAVRVKGIPPELEGAEGPLPGVGWGAVPLYTDFFFGSSPVGIHHNAYIFGLKAWRLENWWNMTWYYPRLRELVTEAVRPGRKQTPLAKVSLDGGGEVVYLTAESGDDSRRASVFDGSKEYKFAPIEWDGVCQKGGKKWYDVLFGDDKGPLEV